MKQELLVSRRLNSKPWLVVLTIMLAPVMCIFWGYRQRSWYLGISPLVAKIPLFFNYETASYFKLAFRLSTDIAASLIAYWIVVELRRRQTSVERAEHKSNTPMWWYKSPLHGFNESLIGIIALLCFTLVPYQIRKLSARFVPGMLAEQACKNIDAGLESDLAIKTAIQELNINKFTLTQDKEMEKAMNKIETCTN